jgi:hypothetical protein
VVSVAVSYVADEEQRECPRTKPWKVVIDPGKTWYSQLNAWSIDEVEGFAVQSRAWVTPRPDSAADPRAGAFGGSRTVQIQSDGHVVCP